MQTKTFGILLGVIGSMTLLGSCCKSPKSQTDHPTQARVTFTPDLSGIGSGITPGTLTILQNGVKVTPLVDGSLPLLEPGNYTFVAYNEVPDVSIAPQAKASTMVASLPVDADGFIPISHDWFVSGALKIALEADTDYSEKLLVGQQTRELNFELIIVEENPENVTSFETTLSGVASGWDIEDNIPYGAAAKVKPVFTRNGATLRAQVRLLGIQGPAQILTMNLTFSDGRTLEVESDLTEKLAGFNNGKTQPMTLQGNVYTILVSSEQKGSIRDWEITTENIVVY